MKATKSETRLAIYGHEKSTGHKQVMQMIKKQYVVNGETDIVKLAKQACNSNDPTELHLKYSYKMVLNKNALSNHADDMFLHSIYGNPAIKIGEHCKTDFAARNAIISIR